MQGEFLQKILGVLNTALTKLDTIISLLTDIKNK